MVREATEVDSFRLRYLLTQWLKEVPESPLVPSVEASHETLMNMIRSPMCAVLVTDDLTGFLGLILHGFGVSRETSFCSEELMYCLPGTKGASDLMRAGQEWGREKGAKVFTFAPSPLASERAKGAARWAERIGMKPLFTIYSMEL